MAQNRVAEARPERFYELDGGYCAKDKSEAPCGRETPYYALAIEQHLVKREERPGLSDEAAGMRSMREERKQARWLRVIGQEHAILTAPRANIK